MIMFKSYLHKKRLMTISAIALIAFAASGLCFDGVYHEKLAVKAIANTPNEQLVKAFEEIIREKQGKISGIELLNEAHQWIEGSQADDIRDIMVLHIKQLIDICEEDIGDRREFPRENLAYQALVEVVHRWPKRDVHRHISNCLDANFISGIFSKHELADQEIIREEAIEVVKSAIKDAEGKVADDSAGEEARQQAIEQLNNLAKEWERSLKEFIATWSTPEKLRAHVTYEPDERFSYKGRVRDLPIRSLDDFEKAAYHVAEQCFEDGVVYFELRFNPYKPGMRDSDGRRLEDLSFEDRIKEVVEAANRGLSKAEEAANERFGG